jgi:phage tail-like protein
MEGGLNTYVRKFPGRLKQTNLTLKRGIVDKLMWDWFYATSIGRITFRGGTISVFDPSGKQEVLTWRFVQAFPARWVGPELNAAQNSVAVETLELCHQGLIRER